MIEVIGARSGDRTISYDGKLLASRIDPRSEAQRWCEKYSSELKGIKAVIVIGAGAAYHLAILKKTYPHLRVICIEFNKEIIQQVRNSIEISLLGIEIIHFESAAEVFKNKDIRSGLASSYRVITHPSSQIHAPGKTVEAMLQLNGRMEQGLREILALRGLEEEIDLHPPRSGELFSLMDIEEIFDDHNLGDSRAMKAARELLR